MAQPIQVARGFILWTVAGCSDDRGPFGQTHRHQLGDDRCTHVGVGNARVRPELHRFSAPAR
jgi:hypothetical protein